MPWPGLVSDMYSHRSDLRCHQQMRKRRVYGSTRRECCSKAFRWVLPPDGDLEKELGWASKLLIADYRGFSVQMGTARAHVVIP
jgi:hypothetical protein